MIYNMKKNSYIDLHVKEIILDAHHPFDLFKKNTIISPDNRCIAYISNELIVKQMIINGKEGAEYDEIDKTSSLFSPDSKHFVYLARKEKDWVIILDGNEFYKCKEIFSPIFSPDSKQMAFFAFNGEKWKAVIDGIESNHYDAILEAGFKFSPDCKHVAFVAKRNNKFFTVIDNKEGDIYDYIKPSFHFSPNSVHFVYEAKCNNKWRILFDEKELKEYDGTALPIFNSESNRFAYYAMSGGSHMLVLDDTEGEKFDVVETSPLFSPLFSPCGKHLAYIAIKNNKYHMIVDGIKSKPFDKIGPDLFSIDGKHHAYTAELNNKWFVMTDENEGEQYDKIIARSLAFSNDSKILGYCVKNKNRFFIVLNSKEGIQFNYIYPYSFRFSSCGHNYLFIARNRSPWLGGKIVLVEDAIERTSYKNIVSATHSPDGNFIVFLANEKTFSSKLFVVVLSNQIETRTEELCDFSANINLHFDGNTIFHFNASKGTKSLYIEISIEFKSE